MFAGDSQGACCRTLVLGRFECRVCANVARLGDEGKSGNVLVDMLRDSSSAQSSTQRPDDGVSQPNGGVYSIDDLALVKLFGEQLVIVVSTRVPVRDQLRRVGRDTDPLWRSISALYVRLTSVSGTHDRYQMGSGYNVPYTLDGESSVALSCWVRAVAEARDENRDKAAVQPVSLPSSRNRNVGKATWSSGSSLRPLPGACLLVSWLCGLPWPLAFCSGSVCLSGLVVCSWPCCFFWFRPPGLFLSFFLKEVTTQGTDPRTDLQAGILKYVRYTWTWDPLLGIYYYFVSSCFFFSALPRAGFNADKADFYLCHMPLSVTAHSGHINQHRVPPLPGVPCAQMFPPFLIGCSVGLC